MAGEAGREPLRKRLRGGGREETEKQRECRAVDSMGR
jgi:hypothetical protein